MRNLILKPDYKSKLDLFDTEEAIKFVKDNFERLLAEELSLIRVSAPIFVDPETGLNDNLNGHERPVRFDCQNLDKEVEIVQSLAKWKRKALAKYHFNNNTGLYTDMNAIRRDEELDNIHSIYVDQWDWEKIILPEERNFNYLQKVVKKIYSVMLETEKLVNSKYPQLEKKLPEKITFISTEQLLRMYPTLNGKERENAVCKEFKAIFIYKIGWPLSNGLSHDGRSADYDDWNLNGDILVWDDVLDIALELSSMGIRVDKNALINQLAHRGEMPKLYNQYSKEVVNGTLPQTIGGGIGQSRLCMFFLEKAHIGEVQASIWSYEDIEKLKNCNIYLL